jgi:hypothetical protein
MLRSVGSIVDEIRVACERVAAEARHVRVDHEAIAGYAQTLPVGPSATVSDPEADLLAGSAEELAAFWLTLDAINFGSGWFPTLRKRPGRSGYDTIAAGVRRRFARHGPWSAEELAAMRTVEIADALDQDPDHELMELFAGSLGDIGRHVQAEFGGSFAGVVSGAAGSAVSLVECLATWDCFADTSVYHGFAVPFLKRAQISAADLGRAGVAEFRDLGRLTMFADNLVPHVLRLDGILHFDPRLVARIDLGAPIAHGSPAEVEIRACAVDAVERIVAARPGVCAADIDELLWNRGREARYKGRPRHRSRCTAY